MSKYISKDKYTKRRRKLNKNLHRREIYEIRVFFFPRKITYSFIFKHKSYVGFIEVLNQIWVKFQKFVKIFCFFFFNCNGRNGKTVKRRHITKLTASLSLTALGRNSTVDHPAVPSAPRSCKREQRDEEERSELH